MNFPELTEVEGKLKARRAELAEIFADATSADGALDLTKVKGYDGDTAAVAAKAKGLNDELADLGKRYDELRAIKAGAEGASVDDDFAEDGAESGKSYGRQSKSASDLILESGVFDPSNKGKAFDVDVDVKTVFTTAAGWAPEDIRTGRLVENAQRQPFGVIDLIPTTTTSSSNVIYMEETTFTNDAVEVAEGAVKPEGTLALTEKSSAVRKIAVLLPVTDEQLEDEPRVRGYVENRLPFMVRQRLSSQVLVGDGIAPNLRGTLNVVGIQTQAKGADPTPDAIYKAMVKVMTTGQASPNGVAFNPLDWQEVRLLRTVDGIYIWGSPSEAGPERIWGLQVALDQALTENTAIVADWSMTELAVRRGLTVDVGYNTDDFARNQQTFRAEMRAAFIAYRPTAICTVTGV